MLSVCSKKLKRRLSVNFKILSMHNKFCLTLSRQLKTKWRISASILKTIIYFPVSELPAQIGFIKMEFIHMR
jgi:hypothetical protein